MRLYDQEPFLSFPKEILSFPCLTKRKNNNNNDNTIDQFINDQYF